MDNKKESYQNFVFIIIILFEIKMGQIILFTFFPTLCVDKKLFPDWSNHLIHPVHSVCYYRSQFYLIQLSIYILLLQGYSCVVIIYSDHWRCMYSLGIRVCYVMTKVFQLC